MDFSKWKSFGHFGLRKKKKRERERERERVTCVVAKRFTSSRARHVQFSGLRDTHAAGKKQLQLDLRRDEICAEVTVQGRRFQAWLERKVSTSNDPTPLGLAIKKEVEKNSKRERNFFRRKRLSFSSSSRQLLIPSSSSFFFSDVFSFVSSFF